MAEERVVEVSLGHSGVVQRGEIVTCRVVGSVLCMRQFRRRLLSTAGPVSNCDREDSVHGTIQVQPTRASNTSIVVVPQEVR